MNAISAPRAPTRNCQYKCASWPYDTRRTRKYNAYRAVVCKAAAPEPSTDNATTTGPVHFWPTRVRVQHDSYIRANRAAVWQLMQDVTSDRQWSGVSVVLATLESIYGVEYQGLAEQLLTAFQEANLAPGPATTAPANGSNVQHTTTSSSSGPEQQQQQQPERQYEHLGASVLGLNIGAIAGLRRRRRVRSRGSSPSSSSSSSQVGSSSPTESIDSLESVQQHSGSTKLLNRGTSNGEVETPAAAAAAATVEEEEIEAAAAADALFTQLLLLLAMRAGFVPLCERDVQLSISLNTDFLWQLFVKANTEQLDDQFVANTVELFNTRGGGSSTALDLQLPKEASKLLVLRRGYSSEKQRGRWLLQKLDYLQLLLVKRLVMGVTSVGSVVWNQVQQLKIRSRSGSYKGDLDLDPDLDLDVSDLEVDQTLDKDHSSSKDHQQQQQQQQKAGQLLDRRHQQQQQQQQQRNQERGVQEDHQLTGIAAALAALAGRQQPNSSNHVGRRQQRRRRPQVDAFGRSFGYLVAEVEPGQQQHKAVNAVLAEPATRFDGSQQSADNTSSSKHYQQSVTAPAATDPTARKTTTSSSRHKQQSGTAPAASDPTATNALTSSRCSSNKVTQQSGTAPAATDPTARYTTTSISTSSSSKDSSSKPQQQRQHSTKQLKARERQQQRRQQLLRMLGDLRSNVSDRLKSIARTLSDWGIIPRMDVITLERFDEVFPLNEASRLRPLYIEKATLPDVMDPAIEQLTPGRLRSDRRSGLNPDLRSGRSGGFSGLDLPRSKTPLTAADGSSYSSLGSYDAWDLPDTAADSSSSSSSSSSSGARSQDSISSGGLFEVLWQPVEIVEPTFRQLLVVYRKKPRTRFVDQWRRFKTRVTGRKMPEQPKRRSAIQLQVYRDIPLPSWQVVFPDKLLQFRPLDLLRLDIFGVAGIGAALAQAKYTSIILQLLTLASLSVWIFRITLGYFRMGDRYKSIIAQLLAERTVAGGEGGLEYLATAAGLQQFKQAALVYVLLASSDKALTADDVAEAAEKLLEERLQLQVCFNVEEALQELQRFGLLVVERQQQQQSPLVHQFIRSATPGVGTQAVQAGAARGAPVDETKQVKSYNVRQQSTAEVQLQQQRHKVYRVLGSAAAQQVLQQYWAGLLQQRVNSILRDV